MASGIKILVDPGTDRATVPHPNDAIVEYVHIYHLCESV